ncbi:MAG: T9SS type A sorting domain-containing protein [Bacteroidia bacterium]|nr:T9SS type A sorting domain-containing protein [Bacteroidia bacterium]
MKTKNFKKWSKLRSQLVSGIIKEFELSRKFRFLFASAMMLLIGLVSINVSAQNVEENTYQVKVVRITDDGRIDVDEQTISSDVEDLEALLKKLDIDISDNNAEGESHITNKVIVIKSGSLDELDHEKILENLDIEKLIHSIPPKCKKVLKEHCKKFNGMDKELLIKHCKEYMENCSLEERRCIIKCCTMMCSDENKKGCCKSLKEKCEKGKSGKQKENLDESILKENVLDPETLEFYPNPNNGEFNLNFNLPSEENGKVVITISDISGKVVYKEKVKDFAGNYNGKISIPEANKGIYFLNIVSGDKSLTKKVVVE